jgi:hypothetical protein
METGTQILIERMKTHPEEFVDGRISKWGRIVAMTDCLPEEDKQALKEAHNRAKIEHFNGEVLATLAGERELGPLTEGTIRYQAEGRYATGWNDPRGIFGQAQIKGEGEAVDSFRYVAIKPNGRP